MRQFRIKMIEEVEGHVLVTAATAEQAVEIAEKALWDDGIGAFPDFVEDSKDCQAWHVATDSGNYEALAINEEALKQIRSETATDNTKSEREVVDNVEDDS